MTRYKKFVKKRSLRYKNCKTHRRKGRKAGAGGTWRRKIGDWLGSRRARIYDVPDRTPQQEQNNFELMRAMTNAAHEDGSMLNRIGKFFPGRNSTRIEAPPFQPPPPGSPPPPPQLSPSPELEFRLDSRGPHLIAHQDGSMLNKRGKFFSGRGRNSTHIEGSIRPPPPNGHEPPPPITPSGAWRYGGALAVAISNGSLKRLVEDINKDLIVAKDKLNNERLDSDSAKDPENSNFTELYEKYIDLLVARHKNLQSLKRLVDKTNSLDTQPSIEQKQTRYKQYVTKIIQLEREIKEKRAEIIDN